MKRTIFSLFAILALTIAGCQASYWDRNNTEAVKSATARAEKAEAALVLINGQKANVDAALSLAQAGLEAAKVAKLDAEAIAKAERAVAYAAEKKAQILEAAQATEKAIKEARAAAESAKATGGQSAAERDMGTAGAILAGLGSLFGPQGTVAAGGIAAILGLIVRSKSKQVTEANAKAQEAAKEADAGSQAIRALEAAKKSANGGENKIDFNDPATIAILDTMGKEGKAFVDRVQRG